MGIIKQGVLGGFKNKVGSVVGVFYRDLNVIRALPRPSSKPPTKAQLEQRIKFGMVTSFLSLMSDMIDSGYAQSSGSRSPMNEAVSYHLREAVTGVAPNFTFDYTKLRFSSGKLSIPSVFSVDTVSAGKVDFNWSEDGPDHRRKDATDLINLVVYNPTKDRFVMLRGAAPRSALTFSLQLPPDFSGDEVHCFFSFSSVIKKKLNSKSVYVLLIPVV